MTNLCGRYIFDVLVQKEKGRQVKLADWKKALNDHFFDKMSEQGIIQGSTLLISKTIFFNLPLLSLSLLMNLINPLTKK